MMKSTTMAILIVISSMLIVGRTNARFLPENLRAFDPILNSPVDDDSSLNTADRNMEKEAVQSVTEILTTRSGSSTNIATNKKSLSFRLNPIVQTSDTMESSASNKAEGVNSMVTEQRLSTSSSSPGVGHMQIFRQNFQTRNNSIIKTHLRNGHAHLQQKRSNKRKLGSTPSPGAGN